MDGQEHLLAPGQVARDARNSLDVPAPVTDPGGYVRRVNQEDYVAVNPQQSPDPVRYSDFDGWYKRGVARFTVAFTQTMQRLIPPIRGDFVSGKQEFDMGSSPPRGSFAADWGWDSNRRNVDIPPTDTYGGTVPAFPSVQPGFNQ